MSRAFQEPVERGLISGQLRIDPPFGAHGEAPRHRRATASPRRVAVRAPAMPIHAGLFVAGEATLTWLVPAVAASTRPTPTQSAWL